MTGITAILHTHNDELRIARGVESLRCCEEVLVIDHGSTDGTCEVAERFGAHVVAAKNASFSTGDYIREARHDWILDLRPTESASETLEAALLEWKFLDQAPEASFSVPILEETAQGWLSVPAETRLVHRAYVQWKDWRPQTSATPTALGGHLLRMRLP